VTNEVFSFPAEPHEMTMRCRPGSVLLPTFHVQVTRPPFGVFLFRPFAFDTTVV